GDIFVLCSDGLSGQLSDSEIGAFASALPPAEACRLLVDIANLRGGPDNITVLIVRINEPVRREDPIVEKQVPWYSRIPWPLSALVAGLLLASGAGVLTAYQLTPWNLLVFLLAAGVIVADIVGMILLYTKEKTNPHLEPVTSEPHVYRRSSSQVSQPLLDKLTKALAALQQQVEERQWEIDWNAYRAHYDLAGKLISQEKLVESFREFCQAMHLLTEAMQNQ